VVAVMGRREAVVKAQASLGDEVADMDLMQFPLLRTIATPSVTTLHGR